MAKIAGEKRLLNAAGNIDFLLHALALAFANNEAGIVQRASGVGSESVQDLSVKFRESGGASGIEIEDAERMSKRRRAAGIGSTGAVDGKQRDDDDGAEGRETKTRKTI